MEVKNNKFLSIFFISLDFSKYSGAISDFLDYATKTRSKVHPCIVEKGKVLYEWKTVSSQTFFLKSLICFFTKHEELDEWTNKYIESFEDYKLLIKSFHRAFQLRNENGFKKKHKVYLYFKFIF